MYKKITALIIILFSSSLTASGGLAKASTATAACAVTPAKPLSPLADLYKKRFPRGHDAKQWQEIIAPWIPFELITRLGPVNKKTLVTRSRFSNAVLTCSKLGFRLMYVPDYPDPHTDVGVCDVAGNHDSTQHSTLFNDNTFRIYEKTETKVLFVGEYHQRVGWVIRNPEGLEFIAKFRYDYCGPRLKYASPLHEATALTSPASSYQRERSALHAGIFAPEKLMLIYLFHDYFVRNRFSSLPSIAWFANKKGITTATLAGVLLTIHPVIVDAMLRYYHISLIRSAKNKDDTEQENYLDSYKALQQVLVSLSLGRTDFIKKALEEYIVEEQPKIEEINPSNAS